MPPVTSHDSRIGVGLGDRFAIPRELGYKIVSLLSAGKTGCPEARAVICPSIAMIGSPLPASPHDCCAWLTVDRRVVSLRSDA